jgi:3-oxoadipate enol-lactonase
MPFVANEGADIYWEEHGCGTPVLLIMGLSFTLEMWHRTLPSLVDRYRVILFDNRGMGRSSVPRGPYSIPKMARDAAAVMQAAGLRSAHVVGASMGGMIAQELALIRPDLVGKLVLACTSHSGLLGQWPDFAYVPRRAIADRLERERSVIRLLYADTTPRERIEEDIALRAQCNWCQKGFLNQLAGILLWSAKGRLPLLTQPTLVVHGEEDRLLPVANGREVARRIPGARFEAVAHAGHVMTTDQPEMCTRLMTEFLGTD